MSKCPFFANKAHYLFLALFFFCATLAQNPATKASDASISEIKAIDRQIQKYRALAHSNPAESTKKLVEIKNLCKKIGHKDGAMRSSMCLVLLYYNGGNYKKSIEETRFTEKYATELKDAQYLSDVCRMRANAYSEMGLLEESMEELEKSLSYVHAITPPNAQFYKKALIYESYAGTYEKKEDQKKQLYYRQKSIAATKKITEKDLALTNAKYQNLGYQYASMGFVYSNLKIKDSANYYFDQALKIVENGQHEIYANVRATLYSDMAKFYDSNKEYRKAIVFAKRAEQLEKQVPMPYIKERHFPYFVQFLYRNQPKGFFQILPELICHT
ncbi:MAG: hypothetical protein QM710_11545 [Flavobacterium sp.]